MGNAITLVIENDVYNKNGIKKEKGVYFFIYLNKEKYFWDRKLRYR
jgi:hypothetical protein